MEKIQRNEQVRGAEIINSPISVISEYMAMADGTEAPMDTDVFKEAMAAATQEEAGKATQLLMQLQAISKELLPIAVANLEDRIEQ